MDRRTFLASAIGLPGLFAACGAREEQQLPVLYPSIPPLPPADVSHARLHALLEELRTAYEARSLHVSATLLPGLTREEILARCGWFPSPLPEELIALYTWHNGQEQGVWEEEYPFWFRDMGFSRLELAKEEYAMMAGSYGSEPLQPSLDGVDLQHCFPFAAFNGGWYVFPCKGQALSREHPRPIIAVFEGIDVYFHSFESMLRTCIDWVRHPAYGKGSSLPEGIEMEIWRRHNPGIFQPPE